MKFEPLQAATLVRRYKRFLADVALPGGEILTVHCPNTGAMTGCAEPGAQVWLSRSETKTRKYPHTWELVETAYGLACIHSSRANAVVREAFVAGVIPGFEGYPHTRTEVKYDRNSRIDVLLEGDAGQVYVEVKSVTLCRGGGIGLFPDAVSERGRKHLDALARVAQEKNTRAVLLFCVLHNGITQVSAAGDIDPRYRTALVAAQQAGLEVQAWQAQISLQTMVLQAALPFTVDAP